MNEANISNEQTGSWNVEDTKCHLWDIVGRKRMVLVSIPRSRYELNVRSTKFTEHNNYHEKGEITMLAQYHTYKHLQSIKQDKLARTNPKWSNILHVWQNVRMSDQVTRNACSVSGQFWYVETCMYWIP